MAVEMAPAPAVEPQPQGNFLTRPIFGMAVWVWGLVIIGGVAVWFLFLRKSGTDTSSNPNTQQSPNGMAIDPQSGLPYATTGNAGINPAGAFAGEQSYDPFANTNALLQQLLNAQQGNTNPSTSGGTGGPLNLPGYDAATRTYTLQSPGTLTTVAGLTGTSLSDLYYNSKNAGVQSTLKSHGGINSNFLLPKGTQVYLAGIKQAA